MTDRELRSAWALVRAQEHYAASGSEKRSAGARRGVTKRWENAVDPDGALPPHERARRAQAAMSAHMRKLALQSRQEAIERKATRARMAGAAG